MNKTIFKNDEILKTSFALWYEVNSKKNDEILKTSFLVLNELDCSVIRFSAKMISFNLLLKKQTENKPQKLSYLQKLRIFLN